MVAARVGDDSYRGAGRQELPAGRLLHLVADVGRGRLLVRAADVDDVLTGHASMDARRSDDCKAHRSGPAGCESPELPLPPRHPRARSRDGRDVVAIGGRAVIVRSRTLREPVEHGEVRAACARRRRWHRLGATLGSSRPRRSLMSGLLGRELLELDGGRESAAPERQSEGGVRARPWRGRSHRCRHGVRPTAESALARCVSGRAAGAAVAPRVRACRAPGHLQYQAKDYPLALR